MIEICGNSCPRTTSILSRAAASAKFAAGGVVLWLFSGGRGESEAAERRAQELIAISFYALAAYVVLESVRAIAGTHPDVSVVGIGLALVTAVTMPLLARAKRRVGRRRLVLGIPSPRAKGLACPWRGVLFFTEKGRVVVRFKWSRSPQADTLCRGIPR